MTSLAKSYRLRLGYAHVANNLYEGWGSYAIGGSSGASIKSEANVFIPKGNKEVTWRGGYSFYSVGDLFKNGASFTQTAQIGPARLKKYGPGQRFQVASADAVRDLTSSAGAQKL
ncbi:probable pectate lyase 16 [Punica granatum]|uniref:Pectate lyase n=1 Tax=Punica granatum TaxID=22663 RepID=A0A6P8BMS2_PUNGR|nr:probable pectate lyase 16 [Punica granatum]